MLRQGRLRLAVACAATLVITVPLAWLWQRSLLPTVYSIVDMGYVDDGGVGEGGHGPHAGAPPSVTTLVADPNRPADVSVTLTARRERFRLASGREIDGYTLNGQSPGPLIEASVGQLVQVRLVNYSVP